MAGLQVRNGSYRIIFRFKRKQYAFTLGEVTLTEAEAKSAQVDYLLMRLRQKLIVLPENTDIISFIQHDGKPPQEISKVEPAKHQETTLGALRDQYLETHANGSIEANTLYTIKLHFNHLCRGLGEHLKIKELNLVTLQDYVNKRSKKVNPVTIRKELATFRAAWNWGELTGLTTGKFPNKGLRFPKTDEKPPFMTMSEIVRRIASGGSSRLWEGLYLLPPEIEELLSLVKSSNAQSFVYPLTVFAAHTGARRSEIIRVKIEDVDFESQTVVIREKKRSRLERTHRRVPLTTLLTATLREWLSEHPGGSYLFGQSNVVARSKKRSPTTGHQQNGKRPSRQQERESLVREREAGVETTLTAREAYDHFKRALRGTKYQVVRGFHVFRHSFCSNLAMKGIDQRMIDEFVGHQSPEQQKRYRHLSPSSKAEALKTVFE